MKYISPILEKYNETTKDQSKIISIHTISEIISDVELFCRFYFNGTISESKASKISSNTINCLLKVQKLTLNTEFVKIGIFLNQSNIPIELHIKNLTHIFIKEPISISNVPKTLLPEYYSKKFNLNFDDLRKMNEVSFTNFSVQMNPELHSAIELDCTFASVASTCVVPLLSFNSVPIRIEMILKVNSEYSSETTVIKFESLYHKGTQLIIYI